MNMLVYELFVACVDQRSVPEIVSQKCNYAIALTRTGILYMLSGFS